MLSGTVLTLLIHLSSLQHMLSLEMGSTVGVFGLSVGLNDVSIINSRIDNAASGF